jgi:hypothetical protein
MPYEINQREVDAVFALPGPDRYEHFIKRVADWKEVWGLASEGGWVMMGDSDGHNCIPFWPHPKYAEGLAADDWGDSEPKPISLHDLLAKWLPGMASDGLHVAVFPSADRKSVVVDPLRLKRDVESECEQYD